MLHQVVNLIICLMVQPFKGNGGLCRHTHTHAAPHGHTEHFHLDKNSSSKACLFKLRNLHVEGGTKEEADLLSITLTYLFPFPQL